MFRQTLTTEDFRVMVDNMQLCNLANSSPVKAGSGERARRKGTDSPLNNNVKYKPHSDRSSLSNENSFFILNYIT